MDKFCSKSKLISFKFLVELNRKESFGHFLRIKRWKIFDRYAKIIKPIKNGRLKRKMVNVELPYHERGRVIDINHAIIIEKIRPTIIDIKLERKYIIIEIIRKRNEDLK